MLSPDKRNQVQPKEMLVNSKVEKTITLPSIQSSPNIHISYLMSPDNKTEPRKIKKSLKISKSSVFVGNDSKFQRQSLLGLNSQIQLKGQRLSAFQSQANDNYKHKQKLPPIQLQPIAEEFTDQNFLKEVVPNGGSIKDRKLKEKQSVQVKPSIIISEADNDQVTALRVKKKSILNTSSNRSSSQESETIQNGDQQANTDVVFELPKQLKDMRRLMVENKRESMLSAFTQNSDFTENDEEYDVWDNFHDVRVATMVIENQDKKKTQQFLQLYKARFGGFPGQHQPISNEQVIEAAVKYAAQNKKMFRKYFPSKQIEFDDQQDYSKPYDETKDENFKQYSAYVQQKSLQLSQEQKIDSNRLLIQRKPLPLKHSQYKK